jgi:hypothetical protein
MSSGLAFACPTFSVAFWGSGGFGSIDGGCKVGTGYAQPWNGSAYDAALSCPTGTITGFFYLLDTTAGVVYGPINFSITYADEYSETVRLAGKLTITNGAGGGAMTGSVGYTAQSALGCPDPDGWLLGGPISGSVAV